VFLQVLAKTLRCELEDIPLAIPAINSLFAVKQGSNTERFKQCSKAFSKGQYKVSGGGDKNE